jgi:hypothetical protein
LRCNLAEVNRSVPRALATAAWGFRKAGVTEPVAA